MSAIANENRAGREKGRVRARRSALKLVPIAWPTVLLTLTCLLVWLTGIELVWSGLLPLWAGGMLSFVAAFAAFTPMHDASHQSVGRSGWLNEVVGRLASIPLMAPFLAFRYLHLEHHKHTNEPDRDPDFWSGSGPSWLLPLKWLSQDLHYYVIYARVSRQRPVSEVIEAWSTFVVMYGTAAVFIANGFWLETLVLWLIPARLAIAALAWGFDYLPHRPHDTPAREDRFRATHIIGNWWLTPLFLYQNYHLIHHLYPGVPFYRYIAVWKERRQKLEERGAQVKYLGQ